MPEHVLDDFKVGSIGPDTDGEPLLSWLAIGYHDIYQ
jgi:hypothetical protein